VRNGRGFAGCDTGDALQPISDPRGLPENVSDEVKKYAEQWGCDGHSHSFLSLGDLLEYDWTQTVKNRGVVSAVEYFRWTLWDRRNGDGPESHSGGVFGPNVTLITEEEMQDVIDKARQAFGSRQEIEENLKEMSFYCQVEWEQPYYKLASHFFSTVIPELLKLSQEHDDVRLVFWFDN
jgi:hypothetical protein